MKPTYYENLKSNQLRKKGGGIRVTVIRTFPQQWCKRKGSPRHGFAQVQSYDIKTDNGTESETASKQARKRV